MFRIAICDDDAAERERTAALLRDYLRERPQFPADVSLFESGRALLREEELGDGFDLYILDVLMPGHSGIEVGRTLREMGREGAILLLTASADYAVDSYQIHAFFYLVKPVERERLFEVLDRAAAAIQRRESEVTVINIPGGTRTVPLADILYIERAGRSMRYYLTGGETVDSRAIRCPFREAAAPLLADSRFICCGAGFVLNLQHVEAVERTEALLDSGGRVPLSRALYREVKQAWMDYWLGGD